MGLGCKLKLRFCGFQGFSGFTVGAATAVDGLSEILVLRSCGSFRNFGVPYFGVLITRTLLFRVLYDYEGPLFSETPILRLEV